MSSESWGAREWREQIGSYCWDLGRNTRAGPQAGPGAAVEGLDLRFPSEEALPKCVCREMGQAGLSDCYILFSSLKLICALRTAHILFIPAPGSQRDAWQAPANVPDFLLFSQMGIYLYCECLLNCHSWQRGDKASWGRPRVWVTQRRTIPSFCTAHFPGSFRVSSS